MSTFETLRLEREGDVALLTLDRAEKRNAVNDHLARELIEALELLGGDDGVRAVVLTGAGKGFCAGADLEVFADRPSPAFVRDYIVETYLPLIGLLSSMPKPVIAAVNGVAAGAGASIALACDLRVMDEESALLQAFINIGLVPDAGSTWLLARQIGYSRAFELAIEGEPLSARRCLELGLANRVVTQGLLDEAMNWAERLAARPTLAVGLTKRAMHFAMEHSLEESIEFEAELQQRTIASEDHREGVAAFLEKREPDFKGK